MAARVAVVAVIEWVVLAALVVVFAAGIVPIMCAMFRVDDPYIPSREYAEDFAARMSGTEKPGSSPSALLEDGSGDDYLPGKRYAEDFAAHLGGTEKPGSSPSCPFQHGEDASPGEGPGDIVSILGAGPRDLTTRPTPVPPARRSAAETDRIYTARP